MTGRPTRRMMLGEPGASTRAPNPGGSHFWSHISQHTAIARVCVAAQGSLQQSFLAKVVY